jgi:ubiquinol-cytochrome c reductase iron-sulfur subunit
MSIEQSDHSTELTEHPETFPNPGLPPHRPRLGDEDPKAAKRSERLVLLLFTVSVLASIAAIVGYFAIPVDTEAGSMGNTQLSTLIIGLGLGLGMLGIGTAAIHWAKSLMNDHDKVEERHEIAGDAETRSTAIEMFNEGARDTDIARRPLIKGALGGALALAPLPFLVPLIGNLGGDWDISRFKRTAWAPAPNGDRVYLATDPTNRRIKASEVTVGSLFHVMPWNLPEHPDYLDEKAKAVVLLVRVDPQDLKETEERASWSYDGIVAYSKICTHVGCPVALYERETHHLLCPCHQSTFDVTDEAKVVFGPAGRALPQLPIDVDENGYLVAQRDFDEPVGPSFWERER